MSVENDNLFTGERFIPGIADKKLETEHLQRYLSIKPLAKDKKVLDAACGEGYGSAILAETASSVAGIDIDADTINRAKKKYSHIKNLAFYENSIADLKDIANHSVDLVISFETIEHVSEELQYMFLREIDRVLVPNGILVMSTPNKAVYSDLHTYHNKFHIKEFYKDEFYDFLKSKFANICFYNQYHEVLSVLDNADQYDECVRYLKNEKDSLKEEKYIVAIATNGILPAINIGSVYLTEGGEYERLIQRILSLQEEVESRNSHLKKLDCEIEEKGKYIRILQQEKTILQEQYEQSCLKLQEETSKWNLERNELIDKWNLERNELIEKQAALQQEVLNKIGHIELLLPVEREYKKIINSKMFKLMRFGCSIIDIVLYIPKFLVKKESLLYGYSVMSIFLN